MPEKNLENVDFYYNWNSLGGAFYSLLNYYNERYTVSQFMGLSTLAFRIHIDDTVTPYCPTMFDLTDWLNHVGNIFGLKFESTLITNNTENMEDRREQAINKITKWLDNNNPVIYFEPQNYEWYLIIGYNTDNKEFIIAGMDGDYYIQYNEIGYEDNNVFLWCIYPEKAQKMEAPEKFFKTLNYALDHYFFESPNEYFQKLGYKYGHNAWKHWLNQIPSGNITESGMAYNLKVWKDARENAWLFLSFLYENTQEFKTDEIEKAINYYKQATEYLSKLQDFYPLTFWTEKTLTTDDYRIRTTQELLEKAWKWDEEAFKMIKIFLEKNNQYVEQ